jgi:hypothetical protein
MGRDIYWYAMQKTYEHDPSKSICIDLEYELEHCTDVYNKIYDKYHTDESEDLFLKHINKDKLGESYYWELTNKWCPKCHLYVHGLFHSPLLIDEHHIQHSYSNPIWSSDWNVRDTYMGSSRTDFIRHFSKDRLYREITIAEFEDVVERYNKIGKPIRDSDREAFEEAQDVFEFIRKWIYKDDVRVVISDEH